MSGSVFTINIYIFLALEEGSQPQSMLLVILAGVITVFIIICTIVVLIILRKLKQ